MINWVAVGQFALAVGVGGVIVAIINNFLSPKTRAETRQIASTAARDEVKFSIDRLEADIKRASDRADAAEDRAAKADLRAENADRRADESDAKYDAVHAQNRVLIEHIWRLSSWVRRYYEAGHPPGMDPPPVLARLEELDPRMPDRP